jgi:FeS assembly SUF system regulator
LAIRLSSLADYAVVLMRAAATHCGGTRLSAADLAAETGIPVPTAQKLVSLLARAGLLRALRGSGGGVKLARPAASISLADIIEAVDGPISLTPCSDSGNHDCLLESRCGVQPHWGPVNQAFKTALSSVTLATLIGGRITAPLPFGPLEGAPARPAMPAEALS